MRAAAYEGQLQILAAVGLLNNSRLVTWTAKRSEFVTRGRDEFEQIWRVEVDPVFGRLICWISFSAGAELLAKGLCLLHQIRIRKEPICVPRYPSGDLESWASAYRKNFKCAGTTLADDFGQLGALLPNERRTSPAHLLRLCNIMNANQRDEDMLISAYDLLRRAIRNRDVHAYVPNTRDSHHNLVPNLFSNCFNLLVSWIPGGAGTLNTWQASAPEFVASMS